MWDDEEEEEETWPAQSVDSRQWQPPSKEPDAFSAMHGFDFEPPCDVAPCRPALACTAEQPTTSSSRPFLDMAPPGEGEDDWLPAAGTHRDRGVLGQQPTLAGGPPSWHLVLGLVVGGLAWLGRHVPDEASLSVFLQGRYGVEPPAKSRMILPDRSHSSLPYNTSWHDGWVAALGRTAVRDNDRFYEHYYLGVAGRWLPMPYPPRVHLKGKRAGFKYGAGLCYGGRCVCIPDKKAPCMKLTFDSSSLLSLMLGLNGALFLAGLMWPPDQWPNSKLSRWCTLSLYRLWDWHLLPLLGAPFFHVGIFEFGVRMGLLMTLFEDCAVQGVWLFLVLYVGGSVVHFFGASAAVRFGGPRWLLYWETGRGCRGGLSSLLALLSKTNPDRRFKFSMYMIDIPTPLSPLATIAANAAVDAVFASSRGRSHAEIAGHVVAFLWGRTLAELVI